jgi:hypothetical protein
VCLDHLYDRLAQYFGRHAKKGEPRVQIQLIPSYGMQIVDDSIACVPNGLLFNVDGRSSGNSAAAVNEPAGGKNKHRALKALREEAKVEAQGMTAYFKGAGKIVFYESAKIPPAATV